MTLRDKCIKEGGEDCDQFDIAINNLKNRMKKEKKELLEDSEDEFPIFGFRNGRR
ncbi:MAG: hypothetical protein Nk1A_7300 [Endomicrobiia bacterium]|nr:MAG: hypothetical protein Nk1A_7300 [Endomicrobiia bacterium]